MESEKKSGYGLQITIAIMGLFGALGTAVIANWDKVFVPQPIATPALANPTSGPTLAPPTSTSTPFLPTSTHTMAPPTNTPTKPPSPCEMLDGKSISATQIGYNGRMCLVLAWETP